MRAFSTIEILIALAILTAAITAAALVGFGTPFMLANMKLEAIALYAEDADLSRIEHQSWTRLQAIRSVASTTVDGFERSRTIEEIQDDSSLQAESTVSWTDVYGTKRSSTLETVLTSSTDDNPCDPFVSSSWTTPQARSYPLSVGGLLPNTITNDSYPISDLHAVESTLIASIRATTLIASPTLFFFDVSNTTNTPLLIGNGFDNASTSR
ncbi:MAG: hypothetical protein ABIT47_00475, partial [Candidatus Paceibacterota bacterium]